MAEQKITQVMMDDRTIDASKEIAMVLSIQRGKCNELLCN